MKPPQQPVIPAIVLSLLVNTAVRAGEPVDKDLIPEARTVLKVLESQYGKKTLSGSTSGVAGWILESTGRQLAIQGFDLSGWNSPTWGKTYTPVVENTIESVKAWWQKGGIVQMQFHWKNPTRPDGSAWAGLPPARGTGPVDVGAAVTPGTPVHAALMADLKKNADYLQKLADARVPVLWRPFHEIDGGWFWWTDKETPENTAKLWRQMYDYLVKERKLHNLIWVYSAGVHAGGYKQLVRKEKSEETLQGEIAFRQRYYPGADYVDIAGIDIYPGSGYGQPTEDVYAKAFEIMKQVAPGKMLSMCESGIPLNPDLMAKNGPKWLYNLQWFEGEPEWDRQVYGHDYIVSLDRLPTLTPHHAPPCVRLVAPADGASVAGGSVALRAEAGSRDGTIAKVEFRRLSAAWKNWFLMKEEDKLDAFKTSTPIGEAPAAPFAVNWQDAPAGMHNVIAKVTDSKGAVTYSNIARLTVGLKNLALGKTLTASSKPETAAKAVDGNLFTSWNGERPGGNDRKKGTKKLPAKAEQSQADTPQEQWLAVDLGAEQNVGGVAVSWWKAYARDYRIDVSQDGQTWTAVFNKSGKSEFCGNTDVISIKPVRARHVRLVCSKPGTDWGGYTVYEFGVFESLPTR
jgi:mannan endo-1,4-beta-mannosidase